MDGSIPRIPGARPTQSIRSVHRRRPGDGDGQNFEEQLEGREPDGASEPEREDLDVGVREEDEAGGSLDLTA